MDYNELLQQAKGRISLTDYVSSVHMVKRVGTGTYGVLPCPVCGVGNNHFRISTKKGVDLYNSFNGCCKGGSIVDYLQEVEGLSEEESYSKTFKLAGMEGPSYKTNSVPGTVSTTLQRATKMEAELEPYSSGDYTEIIQKLHDNSSRTDYFRNRGLSQEIINRYKLGFHEEGLNYVIKQNLGLKEQTNDYMRGYRYFLPVWNANNSCSYFITRIDDTAVLPGNKKPHKTHNLKGQEARLFNDRYLQDDSLTENLIFIVEGIFDALSLEELGFKAIALNSISNSHRLVEQIQQNRQRLKNKVFILAPDKDKAGEKLLESRNDIRNLGLDVFCYELPRSQPVKDLNEFLVLDRAECNRDIHQFLEGIKNKDRVSDYLGQYIQELNENKDKKAITTGFHLLDRELGGGFYSGFYVLGAIPSLGKTTLAVQIADNIAAQGHDVLFFSLEMSKLEIVSKSLSREQFKVSTEKAAGTREILNGQFDIATMKKAATAYIPTSRNLFIVEGGFNTNIMKLRDRIGEHIRLRGTKPVVFVDYLQILRPIDDRMNDKQATDRNVTQLKIISREYDIPVVAVSSFNRTNYAAPVGFESFKESGSIEYTADVMMGMQLQGIHEILEMGKNKEYEKREKLNKIKSEIPRKIELIILKNRNGKAFATVGFDFYPKFNLFTKERETDVG